MAVYKQYKRLPFFLWCHLGGVCGLVGGGRGDEIKCNEYLQCERYWDKLFTYVNSFIKTADEETGSEG